MLIGHIIRCNATDRAPPLTRGGVNRGVHPTLSCLGSLIVVTIFQPQHPYRDGLWARTPGRVSRQGQVPGTP